MVDLGCADENHIHIRMLFLQLFDIIIIVIRKPDLVKTALRQIFRAEYNSEENYHGKNPVQELLPFSSLIRTVHT